MSVDLDEVRKIAKRVEAVNRGDDPLRYSWGEPDEEQVRQRESDRESLVDWAIADLARRDAEAAERALPITEDWLRSIGFTDQIDSGCPTVDIGDDCVSWLRNLSRVFVNGRGVYGIATRGQLLYLLAALNGGES